MALLDEAVVKARALIDETRPDLSGEERARIARQVGIGAVKYADLSVAHNSEYVFDLDRMVSLTGNTGPYLQYVVARVRSIFRQAGLDPLTQHAPIRLSTPHERALGQQLLGFADIVREVGSLYEPHRLSGYLFELAQAFSAFYENCPVLKAETDELRQSRLTLSALVLRRHDEGLDLLGLKSPSRCECGRSPTPGRGNLPALTLYAAGLASSRSRAARRAGWDDRCVRFSFGDVLLDTDRFLLERGGEPVTSSRRSSTSCRIWCSTASGSCPRRSCSTRSGATGSSASRR